MHGFKESRILLRGMGVSPVDSRVLFASQMQRDPFHETLGYDFLDDSCRAFIRDDLLLSAMNVQRFVVLQSELI